MFFTPTYIIFADKYSKKMNPLAIIDKYYREQPELKDILLKHSECVANKALDMARRHPELYIDGDFVYEAAMLHDIGIIQCDAPSIFCRGTNPYICHGPLGADMLRSEGFPRHALVCERHTGMGLTKKEIQEKGLPIPDRDMIPHSMEEQVVCFADKFYSKSHLDHEKTLDEARRTLSWLGCDAIARFDMWCHTFL